MHQSERNSDPILAAEEVYKDLTSRSSGGRRSAIRAVDGVSLSLVPGRTTAVVGESGSGKTTLGRLVADLLKPDAGLVKFHGSPVGELSKRSRTELRRNVQMVFQNPLRSFSPTLSIGSTLLDSLSLRPDVSRADRRSTIEDLLLQAHIDPEYMSRRPSEMSGGQLQRVGIVRALAPDPRVIVLDEPTSALDVSLHGEIVNLLVDLQQKRQLAFVLISHDLRIARAMADDVIVMYLGHVLEQGPASEVLRNPLHPYTSALLDAAPRARSRPAAERTLLAGEVVRANAADTGCRLRSRCPLAVDGCERPQQLLAISDAHRVRCWRASTGQISFNEHPDGVRTGTTL